MRLPTTLSGTDDVDDPDAKPKKEITPEPNWIERPYSIDPRKRGLRLPHDPGSLIISATKGRPASKRGRR